MRQTDTISAVFGKIPATISDYGSPSATGQRCDRGVELTQRRRRIDDKVVARRAAVNVIEAATDAAEGAVATVARLPRHDEAAVGQRRDRGAGL
jgi:hypothetical protein